MKPIALGLAFSMMIGSATAQTTSDTTGEPATSAPAPIIAPQPQQEPMAPGEPAGVQQAQGLSSVPWQAIGVGGAVVLGLCLTGVICGGSNSATHTTSSTSPH